jgi:hypothetical protein
MYQRCGRDHVCWVVNRACGESLSPPRMGKLEWQGGAKRSPPTGSRRWGRRWSIPHRSSRTGGTAADGSGARARVRIERGLDPIMAACARCDVPLIEDAAEALGATCKVRGAGTTRWSTRHSSGSTGLTITGFSHPWATFPQRSTRRNVRSLRSHRSRPDHANHRVSGKLGVVHKTQCDILATN